MSNYANANNPTSYLGNTDYVLSDPQPTNGLGNLPARSVNIQPLNSGYLVNIGCQTFAATDLEDMMKKIEIYLKNPLETERLWFEKHDLTLIK